jgi:hypothetical protein
VLNPHQPTRAGGWRLWIKIAGRNCVNRRAIVKVVFLQLQKNAFAAIENGPWVE